MDNISADLIVRRSVCTCGSELKVMQSPTLGYYVKCTEGHIGQTKKRPLTDREQGYPTKRDEGNHAVIDPQALKDMFGE